MKKIVAIVLLAAAAAVPASAEGILDIYGGGINFLPTSVLQNTDHCTGGGCTPGGLQWAELTNVHQLSGATAGIRIGGLTKTDHFSYGAAFNLQAYGVKEQMYFYDNSPTRSFPGGTVLQPGGDLIVGVPLRFVRLYGGAGLNIPIMFYNYEAFSASQNTMGPAVGTSATVGYDLFFGGRFLLTEHFNLFLEDRFSGIFMPITAKDSVVNNTGTGVTNGTLVINSLNSNAIVGGIGFAW